MSPSAHRQCEPTLLDAPCTSTYPHEQPKSNRESHSPVASSSSLRSETTPPPALQHARMLSPAYDAGAAAHVCYITAPAPAPAASPPRSVFQFPEKRRPAAAAAAAATASAPPSPAQTAALEDAFAANQAPVTKEYSRLALRLGMTRADVMAWFRRKRICTPNSARDVARQIRDSRVRRRPYVMSVSAII